MCNLYRSASATAEVFPGYPGLVVADGALRSMNWGFPLARKSKRTGEALKPKPVNNTRADKLETYFRADSFRNRRCLIPLAAFAEAEGPRGAKTRTWFTVPGQDVFACAGIWRGTDEWGAAFSMVMTDANAIVAPVHDRMPVVLKREDWRAWVGGAVSDAKALCRPFEGPLRITSSDEKW